MYNCDALIIRSGLSGSICKILISKKIKKITNVSKDQWYENHQFKLNKNHKLNLDNVSLKLLYGSSFAYLINNSQLKSNQKILNIFAISYHLMKK